MQTTPYTLFRIAIPSLSVTSFLINSEASNFLCSQLSLPFTTALTFALGIGVPSSAEIIVMLYYLIWLAVVAVKILYAMQVELKETVLLGRGQ